jgi:cytochrome c oxidase subunit 3
MTPGVTADLRDEASLNMPPEKIGLWFFLAVVSTVFALFVSAYLTRMAIADWIAVPLPGLLWINTVVLILASVAMQRARFDALDEQSRGLRVSLTAGGLFSITFLVGQWLAWQQLEASGYFILANPANAFFYLLTALHGLHLVGGLLVWMRASFRAWRGFDSQQVRLSVELCTVYWHYLLLIWLVIFSLLLAT